MKIGKVGGGWLLGVLLVLHPLTAGSRNDKTRLGLGIGWGIAYGSMVGVQTEYQPNISDRAGVILAVGYVYPHILGFSFGLRGYFLEKRKKLQPFTTLYLGSVGFYSVSTPYTSWETTIYGISFGGGAKYRIRPRQYLSAELNFIVKGFEIHISHAHRNRLILSLGWQFYL